MVLFVDASRTTAFNTNNSTDYFQVSIGGGNYYFTYNAGVQGLSLCPTATPSATPTATVSVTPSITVSRTVTPSRSVTPSRTITPSISVTRSVTPSASAAVKYSISVYSRVFTNPPTPPDTVQIVYKIGAGSWQFLADVTTNTCTLKGTINNITAGSTLSIGATANNIDNINFRAIDNTTACPTTGTLYCGKTTPFAITVNSTRNVATNISTDKFGDPVLC